MEDFEFKLNQKGIEVIQTCIVGSTVAIRDWSAYIYSFVTDQVSRQTLHDAITDRKHIGIIITNTLEKWLEEQGNNATFGNLIELLRQLGLNDLCGNLERKAKVIKHAQYQPTSTPIFDKGRIGNFWVEMTDVTNFVGRDEELEKLHKLVTENRVQGHSSVALLTSVHGFGGIGKTTLAKMYAWKYVNDFHGNVIWIDSETFGNMRSAFESFAGQLNLMDRAKIAKLDLKDLTKAVYNAFAESKCLFIFDNVEDFNGPNGIKQFLPNGIRGKPYLLLTSRRSDCFPTKRVLPLDVLNDEDSISLIKEYIPKATDTICEKLAKTLERVPLAIHHAIVYIKKSCPLGLDSAPGAVKAISSFLDEYEQNSDKILQSDFASEDGYAKNIFSICEMSLRKIEYEKYGKFARHMLRYISFLYSDDIKLDFLLNLDYQFENVWDTLWRFIPCNRRLTIGSVEELEMAANLLCSYSLIAIDFKNNKIKVHRVIQDAMRFMSPQVRDVYLQRLLRSLTFSSEQTYGKNLLHWVTVSRYWETNALKEFTDKLLTEQIVEGQIVIFARLKSAVGPPNRRLAILELTIPFVKAMKCDDICVAVEYYLFIYKKISSYWWEFEDKQLKDVVFTNYVILANFIIPEDQKSIFQIVFECISLLRIKSFRITFLQELVKPSRYCAYNRVQNLLDLLVGLGVIELEENKEIAHLNGHYHHWLLLDEPQVFEELPNEFPCLKYLKHSFNNVSIDNSSLYCGKSAWNYEASIAWRLIKHLKFNLEAVRSAIAYIYFSGNTISEYLKIYETAYEAELEYKVPEIIVQFLNTKFLQKEYSNRYFLLTLICCLSPKIEAETIVYICNTNGKPHTLSDIIALDYFRVITYSTARRYLIRQDLKRALRKTILTLTDKKWAIAALHKACSASKGKHFHADLVYEWNHLKEQEDIGQIAVDLEMSFSK